MSAALVAAFAVSVAHLAFGRGPGWNTSLKGALLIGCDVTFILSPILLVIGGVLGHLSRTPKKGAVTGAAAGIAAGFLLTLIDGVSAVGLVGGAAAFAIAGTILGRVRGCPPAGPLDGEYMVKKRTVEMKNWWLSVASAAIVSLLSGCSTSHPKAPEILSSTTSTSSSGVAITDEMIGRSKGTMKLSRVATDAEYGYSERSPVKVGGGFGSGSERTYQYLNALRGPAGEPVKYDRIGTCCPFKSPNSPFEGAALLEVYAVAVGGGTPKNLYFNWYDEGDVLVPVGLSAAP